MIWVSRGRAFVVAVRCYLLIPLGRKASGVYPSFYKKAAHLFEIDYHKNKYEWVDESGKAVAVKDGRVNTGS